MENPPKQKALEYLEKLDEETTRLAWPEVPEEHRPRLMTAAVIFGRRFESRVPEGSEPTKEADVRKLLMRLMNDVIEELSAVEGIDKEEATNFLSDVAIRDKIFEMDEVISEYESVGGGSGGSGESLDSLLRGAVAGRREKAVWADHWRSG
ncbi:MAG: hypothetical protein M3494_06220 [Actinomycetota bacterium]|jgi:hypothetical protein|nr:hypothetical protein [Rubrobacter sp.]MDQ3507595.1 hypothetical protein [Actinomycetota bacterium]